MIVGRFVISNTGSTPKYPEGGVRVYLNAKLLATVSPSSRNPLLYIRQHPKSKYASHLLNVLREAGATQEEIAEIMQTNA